MLQGWSSGENLIEAVHHVLQGWKLIKAVPPWAAVLFPLVKIIRAVHHLMQWKKLIKAVPPRAAVGSLLGKINGSSASCVAVLKINKGSATTCCSGSLLGKNNKSSAATCCSAETQQKQCYQVLQCWFPWWVKNDNWSSAPGVAVLFPLVKAMKSSAPRVVETKINKSNAVTCCSASSLGKNNESSATTCGGAGN